MRLVARWALAAIISVAAQMPGLAAEPEDANPSRVAANARSPSPVPLPPVPAESIARGPQTAGAPVGGVVMVSVGRNNIFPIAVGHINRIVTPFRRAGVQTTSPEDIQSRGSVIYVSPRTEDPVTMFVHEDGDDALAVSLTLVPRRIAPVELTLRLPGGQGPRASADSMRERVDRAERWERGQPYVDTLRDVVRRLALQEAPPGYELTSIGGSLAWPACSPEPGITVDFRRGQVYLGAQLVVYVGAARNTSAAPREFLESWCGSPSVAAVALSPSPMLAPGTQSEIFVVARVASAPERGVRRSSVLTGSPSP